MFFLNQICKGVKTKKWKETQTLDGTFSVSGRHWATYLRPEEIHRVGVAAATAGLRGAGLWALDLDDWRGECSCVSRPLLSALRNGFLESKYPFSLCSN